MVRQDIGIQPNSPDIVLSPGLIVFPSRETLQSSFAGECTIGLHPGGGAPSAGKQRQGARGHCLSLLDQRDLMRKMNRLGRTKPNILTQATLISLRIEIL